MEMIQELLGKRFGITKPESIRVKSFNADFTMVDDGTVVARVSSAAVDSDREVVLPSGVDVSLFEKSGTIFWRHDMNKPIALHVGLTRDDTEIVCKARFIDRPADTQGEFFPEHVRAYVKSAHAMGRGVGVSIGFMPKEMRKPTPKDRQLFGSSVETIISKSRMLEWSFTPLAANPEAVTLAVGKGLLDKFAAKAMFDVDYTQPEPAKRKVYLMVVPVHNPVQHKKLDILGDVQDAVKMQIAKRMGKIFY